MRDKKLTSFYQPAFAFPAIGAIFLRNYLEQAEEFCNCG